MGYTFGHIALFVSDLRAAEVFYQQAFDMDVLFREAEGEGGYWGTLPPGTGWDDAEQAGVEVGMVALRRDEFTLPIFHGEPHSGTVLEIGVSMSPEEIEAISDRLPEGATRLTHEHGDLFFADPFGFTCHVYATSERFLGNGEIAGHWLDV
jgi:catechol 2,3-dioxygenase-like lactoylglutathione lyase family enzyme